MSHHIFIPPVIDLFGISVRAKLDSGLLTPTGDQWPLFIFENELYDTTDGWEGFLRGGLLVKVSRPSLTRLSFMLTLLGL